MLLFIKICGVLNHCKKWLKWLKACTVCKKCKNTRRSNPQKSPWKDTYHEVVLSSAVLPEWTAGERRRSAPQANGRGHNKRTHVHGLLWESRVCRQTHKRREVSEVIGSLASIWPRGHEQHVTLYKYHPGNTTLSLQGSYATEKDLIFWAKFGLFHQRGTFMLSVAPD